MPQAARLAFEEERYKDEPDPSVAFDYAMELVKSPKDENKELGIVLLNDLIDDGHRTKDCLVAIARAELDLGRFSSSRRCVERVLKRDPTHEEALALHHEVRTAVRRDGPTGLLVAAGVTVAGFLLVRRLLQSRESHNT